MRPSGLVGGRRATLAALLTVVAGVHPIHLTGALAPDLQADLGFGDAQLGIAVSGAFALSALLTAWGGTFTDRAGPQRALRVATASSAVGFLVLALAPAYLVLVAGILLAAPGNAIAQPGANVLIAEGVRVERRGMALGIKQSAIAVSTAIAGVVSLVLVAAAGWRAAYLFGVVLAAAGALSVHDVRAGTDDEPSVVDRRAPTGVVPHGAVDGAVVRAAALTGFAGAAAVASIGTFLVRAAEDAGLAASTGRLVLTGGSILLIGMRILWGSLADRAVVDPEPMVVRLLVGGTVGYLLLSTGTLPGFVAGAALAFGAGWAWPGLLFLTLVRRFPSAAGRPSGQVQRGMFVGAMIGPFLFGVVADAVSFAVAWWMSAGWGLLAAVAARGVARASRDEVRP